MSKISLSRLLGDNDWMERMERMRLRGGHSFRRKRAAKAAKRLSIIAWMDGAVGWKIIFDGGVLGSRSAPSYGSFVIVSPDGQKEFGECSDRLHINSLHAELLTLTKAVERSVEKGMVEGKVEIIGDCTGVLDFAAGKFDLRLDTANELKGRLRKMLNPMTVASTYWDRKDIEALFGH